MARHPGSGKGDVQAGRPAWRAVVGTLAGVFLGIVFLVALWAKVFDVGAFADTIAGYGLDVFLPASVLAYAALALETLVGVLLVLNVRRLWLLVPLAVLVAFLLWVNLAAYLAWSRGEVHPTTACGCFGNLVQRTPEEALWQDALLMVPALGLSFLGRPRRAGFPRRRVAVAGGLALLLVAFAALAPQLPLDDVPYVTRLFPGKSLDAVCAGRGTDEVCLTSSAIAPELARGRHVLVLADLEDESFAAALGERYEELAAWGADPERSPLFVLHPGEREAELAFGLRSRGAPVELRHVPAAFFRSLYRTLPRTVLVDNGRVRRTFRGFPPLSEITAP